MDNYWHVSKRQGGVERVITISLQTSRQGHSVRESMQELQRLVETAGGEVVQEHVQARDRANPATFIGKGKVDQLSDEVKRARAQAVVFDQELKPVQQRNLEQALTAKVIDRTRLILDIFAQRARTREGQLQVELAQLAYRLPRLTGYGIALDSQTGGIGTRGPGERKLEIDRRQIRDRMAHLKRQIEKIRQERMLQRAVRRSVPVPQVALIGYTNAGKSTLLNALLALSAGAPHAQEHRVYADDKLFATLDPTTRRIRLPSGRQVNGEPRQHLAGRTILFSDTVGFIRKLPTELVAAFRATLEEVATADLLLLVVDASDPAWKEQLQTVTDLLGRLGMRELPRLTAYNKMDRLPQRKRSIFNPMEGILISAERGEGLDALLAAVEKILARQWVEQELIFSFDEGARLAQLHEHMDILSQETTNRGIRVRVRTHPATLAQWLSKKRTED